MINENPPKIQTFPFIVIAHINAQISIYNQISTIAHSLPDLPTSPTYQPHKSNIPYCSTFAYKQGRITTNDKATGIRSAPTPGKDQSKSPHI